MRSIEKKVEINNDTMFINNELPTDKYMSIYLKFFIHFRDKQPKIDRILPSFASIYIVVDDFAEESAAGKMNHVYLVLSIFTLLISKGN